MNLSKTSDDIYDKIYKTMMEEIRAAIKLMGEIYSFSRLEDSMLLSQQFSPNSSIDECNILKIPAGFLEKSAS